jgi:hypothetical protein
MDYICEQIEYDEIGCLENVATLESFVEFLAQRTTSRQVTRSKRVQSHSRDRGFTEWRSQGVLPRCPGSINILRLDSEDPFQVLTCRYRPALQS